MSGWRGLTAAIGTVAVFGVVIGLTTPLLALVLERRGTGETLIGINSAATFAGILLLAPLASRLIARTGLARAMLAGLLICAACLELLPVLDGFLAWMALRFLFGGAEGVMFVAAETWINTVVNDRMRGRVAALYGTALASGFAAGPLLISVTGIDGAAPFLWGAALVLAGTVPLAIGWSAAPVLAGAVSRGVLRLMLLVPVAAAAAALFGLIDGGLLALLAVFGVANGLDAAAAARLVTVLVLGGIVLQLPVAWLADRSDRGLTLAGCGVVATAALVAIPLLAAREALLDSLLFVIGGMIGCFWILGMAAVGERFRDGELAAATIGLTVAYGIGSVAGPALGGIAMELAGGEGLMLAMAAVTGAFAIYALVRGIAKKSDRLHTSARAD